MATKWEYHVVPLEMPILDPRFEDTLRIELNMRGELGWQLTSVVPMPDGKITLILKKPE